MARDIREVKNITDLIGYFSTKLGWNIDIDDFEDIEDISYDFDAADIGLKEESFAKISSLRQLQPLVDGQQWGIFCVEFDSNRFEPSALKKILSGLIPRKRNSADHAVWCQQDLLFICNWGTDNNSTIGLAHFEDREGGLPQIKMFSCAPALEDFTQIKLFEERLAQLAWPKNTSNIDEWREVWSSAFTLTYKQTIQDSSTLTVQLAAEAQNIRNRILDILEVETKNGYVHLLYEKFRDTLIHDMSEQQFADMYAQTVVYGLFSARCLDQTQDDFSAAEAIELIPNTNPFLKSLMKECFGAESKSKLSFDELEIGNVVDLLKNTKTDAIIQDFNRQTGGGREDPVIHFYEEFLTAYDKAQKVQRGVYYTPQPVVNFIVRAVDSILKTEFGYEDGLASEETKKLKITRTSQRRVDGVYKDVEDVIDVPAVQILDPATGTGTFLRQTILQIYDNFCEKNKGKTKEEVAKLWNEYVDRSLLPRVNGFELMMAPYAVAHMKLAMVLKDTGYNFTGRNRLNVFLTNSLEEAGKSDMQMSLFDDPLATESIEANIVKKNHGINVVIGNPPYSVSSSNKGEWILKLLALYKEGLNEKKLNLDDDYIKFIRYGSEIIGNGNDGILAYISNNSFIDGVTHRKMRYELLKQYTDVYIIDLHGSVKKHEMTPDGNRDENVFDIQQGVSINIFVKKGGKSIAEAKVHHMDLYGNRADKYKFLLEIDFNNIEWTEIKNQKPYYFFVPKDFSLKEEYEAGFSLPELFILNNSGIKTDRDSLFIDISKDAQENKTKQLLSGTYSEDFRKKYRVENSSSYKLTEKIKNKAFDEKYLHRIIYRPFDYQWIYYDPTIISRPGYETMQHMLHPNIGLYVKRGFEDSEAAPVFCCDELVCMRAWSRPGSIGSEYLFPLYRYKNVFGEITKTDNFNEDTIKKIEEKLGKEYDLNESNEKKFSAEQLFDYIYGVLHSEKYTSKYREFIKIEFPRVPYPNDYNTFLKYAEYGNKLRNVHCMKSKHKCVSVNFNGMLPLSVECIKRKGDKVFLTNESYFMGITDDLWQYYIGGYQPLQKWLKDRKNMSLNSIDIDHYCKMINAIKETQLIVSNMASEGL